MSYRRDRERIPRFAGSCFFVGLGFFGIELASREQSVSPLLGFSVFTGFLVLSAILIATIVSRLYLQHEIRRLKFDIANLMLLTVLIALPFMLSNAFWECFHLGHVDEIKNDKTTVLLVLTCAAVFLLFPIFFITEALLSWYALLFRRGNR